jgi:hypothetical protein
VQTGRKAVQRTPATCADALLLFHSNGHAIGIDSARPVAALITQHGQRRVAAVTIAAFDRLLLHTRRSSARPLWDALLPTLYTAADASEVAGTTVAAAVPAVMRTRAFAAAINAEAAAEGAAAVENWRRARLVHLLAVAAHMTEFYRGSRVDDFEPVLTALRVVINADLTWCACGVNSVGLPRLQLTVAEETPEAAAFEGTTPSGQVLRWMAAIVHAHGKAAGASGGPATLVAIDRSKAWDPALRRAPLPELLAFATALLSHPTTPAAFDALRPCLLGALGAATVAAGTALQLLDGPLPLLAAAAAAAPAAPPRRGPALPRLLTARPDGATVAVHVLAVLRYAASALAQPDRAPPRGVAAAAAAALCCVEQACRTPAQAAAACAEVLASAERCLAMPAEPHSQPAPTDPLDAPADVADVVAVYAAAAAATARLSAAAGDAADVARAANTLRSSLPQHAAHPTFMSALADACTLVAAGAGGGGGGGDLLSAAALASALPHVQQNLVAPSRTTRHATLHFLELHEQPLEGDGGGQAHADEERDRALRAATQGARTSSLRPCRGLRCRSRIEDGSITCHIFFLHFCNLFFTLTRLLCNQPGCRRSSSFSQGGAAPRHGGRMSNTHVAARVHRQGVCQPCLSGRSFRCAGGIV